MSQATIRKFLLLLVAITLTLANVTIELPTQAQDTSKSYTPPKIIRSWSTTGLAFAGDKFVVSLNTNGRDLVLFSTDLSARYSKSFAPKIDISGGNVETSFVHPVASSLGLGGFPCRDIYVGAGNTVLHITGDGTNSDTHTSGLDGIVRTLLFDAVGTFDHDLLAATQTGVVYRINKSGTATLLVSVGEDIKGMDIVPPGSGFGAYDGQLIVMSEISGLIRAINAAGPTTILNDKNPIHGGEALFILPRDMGDSGRMVEGLYIVFFPLRIVQPDLDYLKPYEKDAIIAAQKDNVGTMRRMHWNGSEFVFTSIMNFTAPLRGATLVTPTMINPVAGCSMSSESDTSPADLSCAPFCRPKGPPGPPYLKRIEAGKRE